MSVPEATASEVTVRVRENGPLLVRGPITLTDHEGNEFELDSDTIALCRCGRSSDKPFCDATHKAAGFDGTCQRQVRAGGPGPIPWA